MEQQPQPPQPTRFNPKKHLIQLKGKLYLETKYRIQWFREEHPGGCIATEIISLDPVMVKATIYDRDGKILATAHAGAVDKGNAVWSGRAVEKSETAAIGRALAHAGYGTQFADMDEGLPGGQPASRGAAWFNSPDAQRALHTQTGLTLDECMKLVPNPEAYTGVSTYAAAVKKVAAEPA